MKKELAHFSQKRKTSFLLCYFVFLDNFYLEGAESNEQKHFCQNFFAKKYTFSSIMFQEFFIFLVQEEQQEKYKVLLTGNEADIFLSFDVSCKYRVLQNVLRATIYERIF